MGGFLLLFTLYVSLSFYPHLFHTSGISTRLVFVMPVRPRITISGILAEGIPGFGIATFLLQDLLGTRHTSCLVITLFTISLMMLSFHCFLFLWFLFVGCFFVLLVFGCVFGFLVPAFISCGMTSYGCAPRFHEAATVWTSLAVINTASKHLHNDLARAIEALEQKKSKCLQSC